MGKRFTLRYLPLFARDLAEAQDYIALNLKNTANAIFLTFYKYRSLSLVGKQKALA